MKKKIVIIGNAPILNRYNYFFKKKENDHGQFVDACEVVIRMNNATNYNWGTGKKTTILGIINRGTPSEKFASNIRLKKKF